MIMENETYDLNGIEINVSDDHRFGTDAFLLGSFSKPSKKDIVCDLCTGCGIIPLIFCRRTPPSKVYGVEIQREAFELFKKSVEKNNLTERVFPVLCDLREIEKSGIIRESVDMVTVNPPYFKENSGATRLSDAQKIARHEILCKLEDVIRAADYLIKYGGTLKICHVPERLTDLLVLMRSYKIEPKELTFVTNKKGEAPWLALVSGKKGGKSGLKINQPIVMRNENGFTNEILDMYL